MQAWLHERVKSMGKPALEQAITDAGAMPTRSASSLGERAIHHEYFTCSRERARPRFATSFAGRSTDSVPSRVCSRFTSSRH